jgi:hypothetical protein
MPAPSVATYSAAAKIAAHTAFLTLLDTGAGNATIKIRTAADVLLCTTTLTDPAGTVNGTTGQLTLTESATPNAVATGTAAYAEICDVAGTVQLALPAQVGTAAVAGKVVMNTLSLVSGVPFELVTITIG